MRKREPEILIMTVGGDFHSYAVAEALDRQGVSSALWFTSDLPHRSAVSISIEDREAKVLYSDVENTFLNLKPRVVWNRRTDIVLDENAIHASDYSFVELECRTFYRSIKDFFSRGAFWVNPWQAASWADHKATQHRAAAQLGLVTPDTLYSNSPEEIRKFLGRHEGRTIFKPFHSMPWASDKERWAPYTTALDTESLPDDRILQLAPGIYQERIDKSHELRVTVMGDRVFSFKLFSQQTSSGHLDWKRSHREMKIEPHRLDEKTANLCRALLQELGLVFGCFDFVVSPEGERVFLEVNQMGQFLFLEFRTGFPLLDAFSAFLKQGRSDFTWDEDDATVFYDLDMETRITAKVEAAQAHHATPAPNEWRE